MKFLKVLPLVATLFTALAYGQQQVSFPIPCEVDNSEASTALCSKQYKAYDHTKRYYVDMPKATGVFAVVGYGFSATGVVMKAPIEGECNYAGERISVPYSKENPDHYEAVFTRIDTSESFKRAEARLQSLKRRGICK